MKNLLILLILLISPQLCSQNAYETAIKLDSINHNDFKEKLGLLINSNLFETRFTEKEREFINHFKLFIENPFSSNIEFSKLKVSSSLDIIEDNKDDLKDSDSDGIIDSEDNCPYHYDPTGGCPDEDGDGVLDKNDKCPNEMGTVRNAGCPETSAKEIIITPAMFTTISKMKELRTSELDKSVYSSFSGVTGIVDGASKFLVDRTKKEIALTFFENFTHKLKDSLRFNIRDVNNNSIPVSIKLSDLYPLTHTLLISTDGLSLPSFGETWIVAFEKDLQDLPFNITQALEDSDTFSATELGYYTLSLISIVNALNKGNHPSDIISEFLSKNASVNNKAVKAIKLVDLFSRNLTKAKDYKKKWIGKEDLSSLTERGKEYLFGWIYQDGKSENLLSQLNKLDNYHELKEEFQYVIHQIVVIEEDLKELRGIENKKGEEYVSAYGKLLDNTIDLVIQVTETTFIKDATTSNDIKVFISKIKPVSKDVKNLTHNLQEKSYAEGLLNILSLLKNITKSGDDNPLIKNVSYYGNFLVDLVNASKLEDSDNVKLILDKYALPISSYRIKRQRNYSIDFASYPGIMIGYEFSNSQSTNFGVTAPIGFSFSFKNNIKKPSSSSSSIFISAVDIGAPFSYRFANDSAEGLPDNITWEQIFAPGIYYTYGFNRSPFGLSLGVQYSPLLRKIETNNILSEENVFRASLSFVVDIPIFNLKKSVK